jgi:dehydrogenase/reductase SDR family member 7
MTKLRERVIWITGASSGIGEQLVYQLAARGNKIIISARREKGT